MKERLYLFDTTLRDGQQSSGIDFTLETKIAVIALLEKLRIDYIEGGYPGANPVDTAFFEQPRTKKAVFTAFGMTRRPGRSVENDPGVTQLLHAKAKAICFVAKTWDYHVKTALNTTNEENLNSIQETLKVAKEHGFEIMLDCEHFFDGYKANPQYALECARTAYQSGARWIVLCDTNGGTLPHEVEAIVTAVKDAIPGTHLGIHAHNDTEQAVANSLAAVRAGVRQIQGTLNGIGERCGNANLTSIIPTLLLKPEYAERFETGVTPETMREHLTSVSYAFSDLINRAPDHSAPYVGQAAFATKAGIHASALLKDPRTYEHVPPESVGNTRYVHVSGQAGKSNLLSRLEQLGIELDKTNGALETLLSRVKDQEARGYSYETADASFYLLALGTLGQMPRFFDVVGYRCMVERRFNAIGELVHVSEAVVKIKIDGTLHMSVSEGEEGPVNALDQALRKDLGKYQAEIDAMRLVDFKVRIFGGGTEAVTRVLIESANKKGERWFTIGVSSNIIDASFEALTDSIAYHLIRSSRHKNSANK